LIMILTKITYMSVLKYGTLHLSVFFHLPSINASRIFSFQDLPKTAFIELLTKTVQDVIYL